MHCDDRWTTLHKNHEQYELVAQGVKLTALATLFAGLVLNLSPCWLILIQLLLWGQEAIWKTFQARLADYLLALESNPQLPGYYQYWQTQRPSSLGLIIQYGKSAFRPTVLFPYGLILMGLLLVEVV
ncbi:hypothetical protein [Bowmanella dokdonensis]|uniref:Uncharacterized protein n=1 Tax=Bowmanella dokdonensis TaxID=751969 RepID=A0A939DR61_9ALTE|nr:hypothetical protein [Bowmanella dokdonensis]MBN7827229.1 hypothetical protein [Bowmanella dokdonensis]